MLLCPVFSVLIVCCSLRYVQLVEKDQGQVDTEWASAFCIAQHPDPYVMWTFVPGNLDGDYQLQVYQLPPDHSVIVDVVAPLWADKRIMDNRGDVVKSGKNRNKPKKPLFHNVASTLTVDHALFGAIILHEGPPPVDWTLPADWIEVLKAPGVSDPHRLIYPLYPDNDQGDSKSSVDGPCIMDYKSVRQHRQYYLSKTVYEVRSTSLCVRGV